MRNPHTVNFIYLLEDIIHIKGNTESPNLCLYFYPSIGNPNWGGVRNFPFPFWASDFPWEGQPPLHPWHPSACGRPLPWSWRSRWRTLWSWSRISRCRRPRSKRRIPKRRSMCKEKDQILHWSNQKKKTFLQKQENESEAGFGEVVETEELSDLDAKTHAGEENLKDIKV